MKVDFGNIISKSWHLTIKNKWLWVFGFVFATFSGGFNFNSFSNFNSLNKTGEKNSPYLPEKLPEQSQKVLGEATNWLWHSLSQVSPLTWILLALGVIGLIVFSLGLSLMIKNFARSSLLVGVSLALNDEKVNLKNVSSLGRKHIWTLIKFDLAGALVTILLFLVMGLGGLLLVVLTAMFGAAGFGWLGTVLAVLGGTILFVAFILMFIVLAMATIYGERLVVHKEMSVWSAWKKAFGLTKGNFLNTVLLGLLNMVLGCVGGCVVTLVVVILFGIPAIIALIPSLTGGGKMPSIWVVIFLIVLFILASLAMFVFQGAMMVFNVSNWTQLFNLVFKEENEEK